MSSNRRHLLVLLLAVMPLTGCLFRSRVVEQPVSSLPLRTSTQQELIDFVNTQAAKIQTMQATVDIDTEVGGVKKGKVTDYKEIRGYVLVRQPAMLRMIGLYPVVRNKAFDMVSDGQDFRLYLPAKSRLVVGRNDLETHSSNQLENLRPQAIYDALLLQRIDPQNEIAVMENDTRLVTDARGHKAAQADYVIDVVSKKDAGWFLSRKIVFSRTDLLPHGQLTYSDDGNLATKARYDDYKDYNGVNFPSQIEIVRPQEEYDIILNIVKLELNLPLTNDQFMLEIPPGTETVHLGTPRSSSSAVRQGENRQPFANPAP
jgi:outer membrane lipoprotein-sorting protein